MEGDVCRPWLKSSHGSLELKVSMRALRVDFVGVERRVLRFSDAGEGGR